MWPDSATTTACDHHMCYLVGHRLLDKGITILGQQHRVVSNRQNASFFAPDHSGATPPQVEANRYLG